MFWVGLFECSPYRHFVFASDIQESSSSIAGLQLHRRYPGHIRMQHSWSDASSRGTTSLSETFLKSQSDPIKAFPTYWGRNWGAANEKQTSLLFSVRECTVTSFWDMKDHPFRRSPPPRNGCSCSGSLTTDRSQDDNGSTGLMHVRWPSGIGSSHSTLDTSPSEPREPGVLDRPVTSKKEAYRHVDGRRWNILSASRIQNG